MGAGEVPRRELPDDELVALLRAEAAQWEATAADYQRHGRVDSAMRLYAEAALSLNSSICWRGSGEDVGVVAGRQRDAPLV